MADHRRRGLPLPHLGIWREDQRREDYITISSGGIDSSNQKIFPQLVEGIKGAISDTPIMVVGGFDGVDSFTPFLNLGIEFFAIGRELLRNPNFVHHVAQELGIDYFGPSQYARAFVQKQE